MEFSPNLCFCTSSDAYCTLNLQFTVSQETFTKMKHIKSISLSSRLPNDSDKAAASRSQKEVCISQDAVSRTPNNAPWRHHVRFLRFLVIFSLGTFILMLTLKFHSGKSHLEKSCNLMPRSLQYYVYISRILFRAPGRLLRGSRTWLMHDSLLHSWIFCWAKSMNSICPFGRPFFCIFFGIKIILFMGNGCSVGIALNWVRLFLQEYHLRFPERLHHFLNHVVSYTCRLVLVFWSSWSIWNIMILRFMVILQIDMVWRIRRQVCRCLLFRILFRSLNNFRKAASSMENAWCIHWTLLVLSSVIWGKHLCIGRIFHKFISTFEATHHEIRGVCLSWSRRRPFITCNEASIDMLCWE